MVRARALSVAAYRHIGAGKTLPAGTASPDPRAALLSQRTTLRRGGPFDAPPRGEIYPRCISPMDSQRAAWGSLGASQGSSRIFSRLGRAGCPWEKYIEDSAAAALSGSLARAQKKSSLQGLAGEVLTICRRGCFGNSPGDRHRLSVSFFKGNSTGV